MVQHLSPQFLLFPFSSLFLLSNLLLVLHLMSSVHFVYDGHGPAHKRKDGTDILLFLASQIQRPILQNEREAQTRWNFAMQMSVRHLPINNSNNVWRLP
jgi:hypothetical protein